MTMTCEHNDCFTCPYPDCIVGDRQIIKKLSTEKKTKPKNKRNAYYERNKEKRKQYQREYYHSHKKGKLV